MSCFINPEKIENYKSAIRKILIKSITKKVADGTPVDIKAESKVIYDLFKAQNAKDSLAQDAAAVVPFLIDGLVTTIQEFKDLVVKANPKIKSQLAGIIESYEEDINNVKKDLGISTDLAQQLNAAQEIAATTEAQEVEDESFEKVFFSRKGIYTTETALATKGQEQLREGDAFTNVRNPIMRVYYKLQRSILSLLRLNSALTDVVYPGIGKIYLKYASGSIIPAGQRVDDTFAKSAAFNTSMVGIITDEKGNHLFINDNGELVKEGIKLAYYSASVPNAKKKDNDVLSKMQAYVLRDPQNNFILNHIDGGSFGYISDRVQIPLSQLKEKYTISEFTTSGDTVVMPESITQTGEGIKVERKKLDESFINNVTNLFLNKVYEKKVSGEVVELSQEEKENLLIPFININKIKISRESGDISLKSKIRELVRDLNDANRSEFKSQLGSLLANFNYNINKEFVGKSYNEFNVSKVEDKMMLVSETKDYTNNYINTFKIKYAVDSEGKTGLFNSYFSFQPLKSQAVKYEPDAVAEVQETIVEGEKKAQEAAPVNKGITNEGPADVLTTKQKIMKSFDDRGMFKKRAGVKALNRDEVQAKIDEAYEWYMKSPLRQHIPFEVMVAAVNSEDRNTTANWTINGIILFHHYKADGTLDKSKSADFTDLYHESWHGFTQTFLNKKQRAELYKEISKQPGSFRDYDGNLVTFANANYLQLEEFLAEDFRKYMLSGGKTDLKSTPVKNSIFSKILEFLKSLFGKATVMDVAQSKETGSFPAVIELYNKLRVGDLSGFTFDVNNRDQTVGQLRSTVQKTTDNIADDNLNYQDSQVAINLFDSIISQLTDSLNTARNFKSFSVNLLKSPENLKKAYQYVKEVLVSDERPALLAKKEAAVSQDEKDRIQKSIDLIDYCIRNFGNTEDLKKNIDGKGLIAYHQMKSKYISYEDRADFFEELDEEGASQKGGSNFDKAGNEKSAEQFADPDIHALLRSLYKFDKDNQPVNIGLFNIRELTPYVESWNKVARILSGTIDENSMEAKLIEAAKTDGTIAHLLDKLGPLDVTYPKEFQLWSKFWQTFNLVKIELIQMNVEEQKDSNNVSNYTIKIGRASSSYRKIGILWNNGIKAITATKDGYIKRDSNLNENYIDVNKVIKDFADKNGKLDPNKAIAFYNAIGITLSDASIKALANDKKAGYIFTHLKQINQQRGMSQIYDLAELFKEYPEDAPNKREAISSQEGNYSFLQDLEARNSDYINNFSVTNAEGNTQFEHSLNNTLSIQANAINSASSYQELMRFPYMQHLNKDKNPWIKSSVWMNSIFDMKTGAKRPGVKINLNNLSGVQFITDDGNSTGISSASADEFTKFIQDFHLSSIAGKPELMRHADKSTSFSMYISKLNTSSKKNLYIDPIEFTKRNGKAGYEMAYKEFIKNYIGSELERINKFKALAKQKNLEMDFDFLKQGQNFVVFEDVLTESTKEKLLAQEPGLSMDEIFELDPELQQAVYKDYTNYFDRQIADVTEMFKDRDFISASYLTGIQKEGNVTLSEARKAALSAFVFNSWINNLESMSVIYGDVAQYNIAKEEFHKRNAGAGSTGTIFRTSALAINFVNADERLYEKYMKRKGIIPVTKERRMMSLDGELNTAVVEDVKIGTEYIKEIEAAIAEDIKNTYKNLPKAEINDKIEKAIGDYRDSMKEGDGQGWLTFDSYRALSKLNNNWTDEQEELYTKIANGEKIPTGKAMQFFPVRKFQYFGTLKNDHVAMTAFHKFSLMPLIPNVIEGKKLEQLHIKMMNEDIDYALFKSGSKVATVTKDGVENKFYTNTEDRTIVNISDAPFTKNVIYLQFLKNQLEIAPEFKGKTTFPTQMRKLVENGLMEGGVPIDFERTLDLDTRIANWAKVKDKEAASNVYKLVKKYEAHVAELTEILKEDLIEQADLRFDANDNVIFSEKLRDFLVKEMERQDLADHEIDFVKYMGTTVARDLSLSLSAEKLEKVLNSIVVNRLVRQKFNGEGLIQVSTAGFEDIIPKFKNATEADKLKYNGTNDLPFYGRGKGKNGKTSATKIKIAMQGDFLKLLQLKHPDGKKIGTIARLNGLITQDEWLDTGDNRSMLTLVGARIPVQGTNSMEFMEVYEFLEESAGNIIILPSEIVVKSGGDFDIDKLTVMMPNIHLINGEPRIIKPKVVKKGARPQLKAAFTKELNELYEQKNQINDNHKAEYDNIKKDEAYLKLSTEEKLIFDNAYSEYAEQRKELRDQIKDLRPQWTKLFNKKVSDVYTPEDFERVDYQLSKALDDLEIMDNNWNDKQKAYMSIFKSEKKIALLKPILDRIAIVKTDLAGISPKAYQNAIISDMREILEMPENYLALVKPNSTYILKDEIADKIATDVQDYDPKYRINGPVQKKIAGTRIFEIGYNLYKHKSNNVGGQVLGMFAVGNTYNSIFNRIGMKLNYSMLVGTGKNAFTKTLALSLNHNKLKDLEGRSVVSLSHLKDANNEFYIADMISQLINGAVDVARDSWLFNIQGNKEVGPTLEFLLEAGVPAKQAVYFVSQPIIRQYVDLQRKARSISARPLGEDIANPNFYRNHARDKMIDQHIDEFWGIYESLKPGAKKLAINNVTVDLKNTQEFKDFISGDNAELNLRNTLSKGISVNDFGYTSDIDKATLLHFFEIEDMAKTIRDVKLRTNFDTTRSASTYEAEDKIILADDLAANQMIPSNVLELIKTQTPIGSFFVQEFQIKAWKNFFDLRNNDTLNLFIRNYIQENRSKIDNTYENVGEFIKDFKNNINSFIFQNELKAFNIDDVTSYKGLSVKNGQYIKGIEPTLRLRSGVAIKQVDGKIAVYVDKAQLQFDYTNLATIAADPIVKDGVVVSRPAKVDKEAFTDRAGANNYYRFVIEREVLRHIYSPKDLETRKDYQNMLANNLANPKYKITTETAELYNERIKALTYEQLLRDMALDNTYNSWKMFQSKDASFASQFIQLLRDYPELKDYDVIKNLSINESKDKKIKNLVFADSLMTGDRLNVFNENFVELANASNIKINATDQEKRRVAEFFDKMSMYAFLQSGMNTTGQLSLIRAVPQNRFLAVMIPAAANFIENINYNTLDQYAELLFKNQADFRTRNRMSNYQLAKYDMVTDKKLAAQGVVTSRERSRVAEPLEKDNMGNLLYVTENPVIGDDGKVQKDAKGNVITKTIFGEEARQILKDNPNDIIVHDTTTAARPSSKKGQYAFYDAAKVSGNTLALPIMYTSSEAYADQTKEDISKGKEGVRPVDQPVVTEVETARTIYNKLGNKTQSKNVEIPGVGDLSDVQYDGQTFWSEVVPEARGQFGNQIIIAYRGKRTNSFLKNYKGNLTGDPARTIGNPFDWQTETGTRDEKGKKSTMRFIHWMITGDNMGEKNATPEYRQAIIDDIKNGKLKNRAIIYYQEKGYATHATALDYLINEYDWNKPAQSQATVSLNKVVEGDIFALPGIPVITTNLGGVHGAGLAQAAKAKGLIKQGEGDFKATTKVVRLPVKKVWSDNMSMNDNMELLKTSLRSLIKVAKANTDKTFLLPLAGLGHGEGSIQDILPLLIKTVQASPNIKLVIPAENVSLGRQGSVRKDYTRENMPTIKAMLTQAGLLGTQPSTSVKEGVAELFKSNPELANAVYEALGLTNLKSKVTLSKKFADTYNIVFNGETIGTIDIPSDLEGDTISIGDVNIKPEFRGKGLGVETYKAAMAIAGKPLESFMATDEANRVWNSLIKQGLAKKTDTGFVTITSQITPQQKQQAISKFQEYVNATGKQDIEGFKNFVTQPSTSVVEGVEELFTSNPELANAVYEALGFKDYNGITVELGRSKVVERGKVQNIIVKYNGKAIIGENKESGLGEMNVMIQSKDAFVGMIRIPTEFQGKGLSKYIYQATADLIGTPIINSKERGESQTESGGYVWKNKTSFQPNQITPQQEQQAQQLYSQYLDTIFPNSKVKDIVYRGGEGGISEEQYYTLQKNYAERYGKAIPVILNLPNPVISDKGIHRSWIKDELTNRGIIGKDYPGSTSDAVIEQMNGDEPFSAKGKFDVYVIKNENQKHVLGSKQDIEGFKKFVTQPSTSVSINTIENLINNFEPKDNFKAPVDSWGIQTTENGKPIKPEIFVSIKEEDFNKKELLDAEDPENPAVQETIDEINRLQKLLDTEIKAFQPIQPSTSVKPKGKQVANGVYVNQEGLTPEEELELFNIIKPVLEAQAVRSNKGIFSPKMAGLGLNWDYLNGETKRRDKGFEKVNIKDPLQKNSTYGWFTSSSTGKRLAPISGRLVELMTKATGIDVTDYDGSIINIYNENSFIGNHPDIDESKTAEKYPVVVVNIGGPGNIRLGSNTNNIKVDLKSGAGYIFGHQGKNRTVYHSTYAAPIKGTLPAITTKMDGETIPANSYRISITMRRVMPLEAGMPSEPAVVSEIVSNAKPSTKILSVPVVNATAKKNIDAFIEQAKLLKAEGKNLAFPKSGLGQEMRKTIKGKTSPSHQTFLYLSERLLELGYLNPGFVKSLSDPQDQTSKTGYKIVQEFQEVSDNEASDNLLNC